MTGDLTVGEALGRYRLLAVLQRGGMGELFVAEDTEHGNRRVVIKRLLEDFVEDETYLAMFRDEARIMSQLTHPNVVQVLETPVLRGSMCLVMELVPGRSVAQILQKTRGLAIRMPPNLALYVVSQALRGLHYAHTAVDADGTALELVHRDVSPGNLLVAFDGQVKVTDFGIAKSKLSVVATSVGVVKGTTRYLSPEQIRGGNVTARADIFACASVLVEMLTGVALFDRGQVPPTLLAIVKGQRPPVSELLPFDAPELAMVLEQSLALSPVHRPATAQLFADTLDRIRPTLGPVVGAEALGEYLSGLFPDRVPTGDLGPGGPLGATYLMDTDGHEVSNLPASTVSRSMPGARPLDATEFEAQPKRPVRPLFAAGGDDSGRPSLKGPGPRSAGPTPPPVNLMDEVEAAARELEARPAPPRPAPPPEEPGVSDSAVEADAFRMHTHTGQVQTPPFRWSTFLFGALTGAAVVYGAMVFGVGTPPAPSPVSPSAQAPVLPPPLPAPPRPPVEPEAAPAQTSTDSETIRLEPVSLHAGETQEWGYVSISRPRRARIEVQQGEERITRRVPVRKLRLAAGPIKLVIIKGKLRREIEVVLQPGQHLDLTRAEIQILEEGDPEP